MEDPLLLADVARVVILDQMLVQVGRVVKAGLAKLASRMPRVPQFRIPLMDCITSCEIDDNSSDNKGIMKQNNGKNKEDCPRPFLTVCTFVKGHILTRFVAAEQGISPSHV